MGGRVRVERERDGRKAPSLRPPPRVESSLQRSIGREERGERRPETRERREGLFCRGEHVFTSLSPFSLLFLPLLKVGGGYNRQEGGRPFREKGRLWIGEAPAAWKRRRWRKGRKLWHGRRRRLSKLLSPPLHFSFFKGPRDTNPIPLKCGGRIRPCS